jgi:hypothetical protein
VDLAEMAAHGTHEAAGSATDLEGAAAGNRNLCGKALQLAFEVADDVGGRREEFAVVLVAAAEGHVVICVFAGALVPVGAHAVADGLVWRSVQGASLLLSTRMTRM